MKIDKISLIFIIIFLLSVPMVIYSIHHEQVTCDTKITMKDGTVYEATQACHTNSGMTWLNLCDNTEISFPTSSIKKIENINQ
jgi:hypothetical protein